MRRHTPRLLLYDMQQQLRPLAFSSSIGCLNFSRGGSPLAGVKYTALPLDETRGMRESSGLLACDDGDLSTELAEPLPR